MDNFFSLQSQVKMSGSPIRPSPSKLPQAEVACHELYLHPGPPQGHVGGAQQEYPKKGFE
jgi:hypothetical protein